MIDYLSRKQRQLSSVTKVNNELFITETIYDRDGNTTEELKPVTIAQVNDLIAKRQEEITSLKQLRVDLRAL